MLRRDAQRIHTLCHYIRSDGNKEIILGTCNVKFLPVGSVFVSFFFYVHMYEDGCVNLRESVYMDV